MLELIIAYVILAVAFGLLRVLRSLAWERKIPSGTTWLFGLVAYVALIAVVGVVFIIGASLLAMVDDGDIWDWIGFLLLVLALAGLTYYIEEYHDAIDFSDMLPFWLGCLRLEDPAIRRAEAAEAPESRKQPKQTVVPDPLSTRPREKANPVERTELKEELERLSAGESVDVADALRVNSLRDGTAERYEHVRKIFVDPEDRQLRFQLLFPSLKNDGLQSVDGRVRVLQQVYDLFQFLQEEAWLADFDVHIDEFRVECFLVTIDSFNMPTERSFLRVYVPLSELRDHAGKAYAVTELERLGRATWI